jgi:hypothetical protein
VGLTDSDYSNPEEWDYFLGVLRQLNKQETFRKIMEAPYMSQRYRITREFQENGNSPQTISLEECKQYFASKPDFSYTSVFTVKGPTSMSIEGDFFMWSYGDIKIPFRYYEGDIYVSGTNEAVIPKMIEVAGDLRADVQEG